MPDRTPEGLSPAAHPAAVSLRATPPGTASRWYDAARETEAILRHMQRRIGDRRYRQRQKQRGAAAGTRGAGARCCSPRDTPPPTAREPAGRDAADGAAST